MFEQNSKLNEKSFTTIKYQWMEWTTIGVLTIWIFSFDTISLQQLNINRKIV